ncbi:type II toxin-antitoxin system RelE/ParE family toxin, partial [Xanthomonas oryzae pv. oryzae]
MGLSVRFTQQAREDLVRLYDWLLQRAEGDFTVAERALQAIG